MKSLFLAFIVAWTMPQAVPQPGTGSIEGIVVVAGSSRPLAGVSIFLAGPPSNRPDPEVNVVTDSAGRFAFRNLPPFRAMYFRIRADVDGYDKFLMQYPVRPGMSGEVIKNVVVTLMTGGNIRGRLSDPNGRPVAGATIYVYREAYDWTNPVRRWSPFRVSADGSGVIRSVNRLGTDVDLGQGTGPTPAGSPGGFGRIVDQPAVQTDSNGNYSLRRLPAAKYYVGVEYPPARGGSGFIANPDGFATTFYPGVMDATKARAIVLEPESNVTGIDFVVQKPARFRVTGTVANLAPGQLASMVLHLPGSDRNMAPSWWTMADSSGRFVIDNVIAGAYELTASTGRSSADLAVDVHGNMDGIAIRISPTTEVKGRLTIKLKPGLAPPAFPFLLSLTPNGFNGPSGVQVQAEGPFTISNVGPGIYWLFDNTAPTGYVADIRQGSRDIDTDGRVTVTNNTEPLEVTFHPAESGSMHVTIPIAEEKATLFEVLLVPDPPFRQNHLRYRNGDGKGTGDFEVQNVWPGSYRLFAWEKGRILGLDRYSDAGTLMKYERYATPVVVSPNAKLDVQVPLIPH